MIQLQTEIENHRLGAFIYGFMTGLGLVLIVWGLTSIITLPSGSSALYSGIAFLGVFLFAGGSCREAYLRGSLSAQRSIRKKTPTTRTKPAVSLETTEQPQTETTAHPVHQEPTDLNSMATEQIRDYPVGTETHGAVVYEQEE